MKSNRVEKPFRVIINDNWATYTLDGKDIEAPMDKKQEGYRLEYSNGKQP